KCVRWHIFIINTWKCNTASLHPWWKVFYFFNHRCWFSPCFFNWLWFFFGLILFIGFNAEELFTSFFVDDIVKLVIFITMIFFSHFIGHFWFRSKCIILFNFITNDMNNKWHMNFIFDIRSKKGGNKLLFDVFVSATNPLYFRNLWYNKNLFDDILGLFFIFLHFCH